MELMSIFSRLHYQMVEPSYCIWGTGKEVSVLSLIQSHLGILVELRLKLMSDLAGKEEP